MTEIDFKIKNGLSWLKVDGHAEDAVVCAAISAIVQTAYLGLCNIAEQYPDKVKVTSEIR